MTDIPERLPKRLTAARLAGVPELELAFCDFTSEYDISDGEGVRPPATGRPVQLLQESLLEMGYDLPSGADGVYGRETQQAAMEFQIDAGHPWPPGRTGSTSAASRARTRWPTSTCSIRAATVSSHVPEATGVDATAARFEESADHLFMGFDASTSPPSLVVGTTHAPARAGSCASRPSPTWLRGRPTPEIATVGTTHEGIVVGGESAGTTTVRATAGGQVLAELDRDREGRARARRQLLLRLAARSATTRRRRCSRCGSTGSGGGRPTSASRSASSRTSTRRRSPARSSRPSTSPAYAGARRARAT